MGILQKLGPGLLYAAAAIGVSHLVQSTRAGASFGTQLVWAVILANLFKYPIFRVGPLYTAFSKKTLLEGYQEIGTWVMVLFYMMTFATMFIVQAAVTVVTAGLAINLFGIEISPAWMSVVLLILSGTILVIGKYNILDNFIKVIIIVLTLTTVSSVLISLFGEFPKNAPAVDFSFKLNDHIFFLVALVGWMPAPMDIPIWHSMWTKAKLEQTNVTPEDALFDFNIGFVGTAGLALCFLLLGALVMYQSGEVFSGKAAVFSSQLIDMYTRAIGEWAKIFIAIAAFTTMFSTTLTCLDAFPRILAEADRLTFKRHKTYPIWLMITILGASFILFFYLSNMKALVDLATTLSFVVGPIYAYFNIKILQKLPAEYQGNRFMMGLTWVGFCFLSLFAFYYIYLKFFTW